MGKYKVRTITCKGCNETVTKRLRPNQEYCSLECYRHSPHPIHRSGKMIKCNFCNKEIYKAKCFLDKSKHLFCSIECQNEWQSRNKVEYECEVCKGKFRLSKSLFDSSNRRFCSVKCRDLSDSWDGPSKGGTASVIKQMESNGPNNLEKKGYSILDKLNIKYKKQELINGKFIVDALIDKLIIEWDGDYWHGHPELRPYNQSQLKQRRKDLTRNKYLRKCGYKILRFWERSVYNYPNQIKQIIESCIEDPKTLIHPLQEIQEYNSIEVWL